MSGKSECVVKGNDPSVARANSNKSNGLSLSGAPAELELLAVGPENTLVAKLLPGPDKNPASVSELPLLSFVARSSAWAPPVLPPLEDAPGPGANAAEVGFNAAEWRR